MKRGIKLAVVVLLAIVLTMPALPSGAIESFGVGGRPANPDPDNPRSSSIFIFEAEPGETVKDGIRVINNNPGKREISVYATDSQNSSDGAFACEQAVDDKDEVGSWIKLEKNMVDVEQGKEETINFTLTVPQNASVGEHNGCIAVQDVTAQADADENGIALSFRSALRVAVTVPGDVVSDLTLNSVTLSNQKDNKLIITPEYTNNGTVSVDTAIDARLLGLFGIGDQTSGGEFPVLRDSTARFNFEVDKPFWGGWYKAKVTTTYHPLSSGEDQRKSTADNVQVIFISPQPLALLIEAIILLLVLGGFAWLFTNGRRRKVLLKSAGTYVVKPGDDIQSIATLAQIPWKKLANLNNLKPPYKLSPGDKLHVPRPKAGTKRRK